MDTHEPAHLAALDDPFRWLEEVEGAEALAWVAERNAETARRLESRPGFAESRAAVREVLDSPDKIPHVTRRGRWLYNFWTDAEHPRGVWRRTTEESYRSASTDWEVVLDVDALNATEGEDWVWHGAQVLRPDFRRALVRLSHGGSDADVTREFDLVELRFVPPEEGGFHRPEAKGALSWVDEDTVFVFTDTGPGSTTTSGYPRTVRRWRRGTPMSESELVYVGREEDLSVSAVHDHTPGFEREVVVRAIDFYSSEEMLLGPDGSLRRIEVPASAEVSLHREWLLVELREPWSPSPEGPEHPAGSLLATRLDDFLAGSRELEAIFVPGPTTSLGGWTWTRDHLVLTVLEDVRHRVEVLTPGTWARTGVPGLPAMGTVSVSAVDPVDSDELWVVTTDFLSPTTLWLAHADGETPPEPLRSAPAFFDATGLQVTQHFATSADGTRVPYFEVGPAEPSPGPRPTLLYGYGGFEVALTPAYSGSLGRGWLERGGTYVLANIRGGGEYGPAWHQAALKENRHRAYEDFEAVARDLVARGVTDPAHLGIQGGSNGGLLTANMLVRCPELFGAVVVQVPLVDMARYHRLLAGASWTAEYGDPDDPEQWEFVRTFSPYHLLDPEADYPPVLVTTSTRDDRVHPGHARKLAAKLLAAGKDVTYYENVEGGHGGAADNKQAAHMAALVYEFLAQRLGLEA